MHATCALALTLNPGLITPGWREWLNETGPVWMGEEAGRQEDRISKLMHETARSLEKATGGRDRQTQSDH